MSGSERLKQLLAEPGPWTYAYIDGTGDVPQVEEEARQRSLHDRLRTAGAPEPDADAVETAAAQKTGLPSPSARFLLVRNGQVELDESFAGARLGAERLGHGLLPEVLPLVRHRSSSVRYLVIETGREGAQVRLERAGRGAAERVEDVEGRSDSLPKVQAGGLSHARYQRHSEEIWKQNQDEVAETVDRLVRECQPAFVVVAGDVRARQLLLDAVGSEARGLVVEVDAHTRAEGADEDALDSAIADAMETHTRDALAEARDRAAADSGARGAHGTEAVMTALQQSQVDTLILDARVIGAEPTLCALDAQPWVSQDIAGALDAEVIERVPFAEALARAALLTGARILIDEPDEGAPGEVRSEEPAHEPIAALRWEEGGAAAS